MVRSAYVVTRRLGMLTVSALSTCVLVSCAHIQPAQKSLNTADDTLSRSFRAQETAFNDAANAAAKEQAKAAIDTLCSQGYGVACTWLGRQYYTGGRDSESDMKATQYFRLGCNVNDGQGCLALGLSFEFGTGSPKEPSTAVILYRKSCDLKYADGCGALGIMYVNGSGVAVDANKGLKLLTTACRQKSYGYCLQLGLVNDYNENVVRDRALARTLYQLSCSGGETKACLELADSLRSLPVDQTNPSRIRSLYRAACEKSNARGCVGLGQCYQQGIGGPTDTLSASKAYLLGCKYRSGYGCWHAGMLLEKTNGTEGKTQALRVYREGCRLENARSCNHLGIMMENGKDSNISETATVYWKGCSLGDEYACRNLGELLLKHPKLKYNAIETAKVLQRQCDGGKLRSCTVFGRMLYHGRAGLKSTSKGVEYLTKACTEEHYSGCGALAEAYESGNGLKAPNKKKASQLRHLACKNIGYIDGVCRERKFRPQAWILTAVAPAETDNPPAADDEVEAQECVLTISKYYDGGLCQAAVSCGERKLYGGPTGKESWIYCDVDRRGRFIGAKDETPASQDGDPALIIDVKTRSTRWKDDNDTIDFKMKKTSFPR